MIPIEAGYRGGNRDGTCFVNGRIFTLVSMKPPHLKNSDVIVLHWPGSSEICGVNIFVLDDQPPPEVVQKVSASGKLVFLSQSEKPGLFSALQRIDSPIPPEERRQIRDMIVEGMEDQDPEKIVDGLLHLSDTVLHRGISPDPEIDVAACLQALEISSLNG